VNPGDDPGIGVLPLSAPEGDSSLLERAEQLAALDEHLASVEAASSGRLVVVAGEAGAGKTTLLRHFAAHAAAGRRLLAGACDALHTPRPLGPFLDLAETAPGVRETISKGGMPHEVASALLAEVGRQPVLLVLEDLHWADEATLDVLRLLARRVETVPVLVLATYRDDELDRLHPLRILLGELPGSVARLKVPPLSRTAVEELAVAAGADGEELYRKTAGNPFFVTEALAAGPGSMPDTVRDAVLARTARLDPSARSLLEAVAIAPQRAELWLLEALEPEALGSLDDCLASGIVVAQHDAVGFRHELARLAVEESLSPSRARELHRAALHVLAEPPQGPPDLALLAHHAEAAGDAEGVLHYATGAGDLAAALGAHREAEAQYARALRYRDLMEPARRAELLQLHSQESYLTDNTEAAIASGLEAVQVYEELGDTIRQAAALSDLSRIQQINGRSADANASVRTALALLEGLAPGPELARTYATMASRAMSNNDMEQTADAARRATELAEAFGDTETLARVLATMGTLEMEREDTVAQGLEKIERSIRMAKEARLDQVVGLAYNNLVYEAFARHDLVLVERCVGECIDYCSERGLDLWLHAAFGSRAELELFRGDWDAAVESAGFVVSRPGSAILRMGPLTVLGVVRARRGDPDPWGPLDEALAIARAAGELQMLVAIAAARAEAAWLEGDDGRAIAETQAVVDRALETGAAYALPEVAYWRRQAGVAESLPVADPPRRIELDGDPSRAAVLWDELGYPYEAALARTATSDDESIRSALTELHALGARATVARLTQRLRQSGVRGLPRGPRATTAANPARLTPREVEVVGLVALGLRDSEIAERLFLSEKTVGHHVSAVLRKLGVPNRGQAALEAARLGLAAGPQDREQPGAT
jgi:DNA-binding CsgD family transcriptional regulator/tetratricopeptide (TPR) repeat protein